MSSQSIRAVVLVVVLLTASLTPLAFPAAADEGIHLSTDVAHVSLTDGQSSNVTLTINNNGTSIESYNVTIDSTSLSSVWEIIASEDVVDNVFPTWSKNTTIIVRLGEGGTPSDSGSFDIIVTEPDENISSTITVFVSVAPSYEPALENSWSGGVSFEQGETSNLTFTAWNYGSVEDTFLLDVEYEPDLAAWWQNQTTVPEPWDEASGNETLMFTQPANGTSHDLSNGMMNVSVEISPLESNVSYLLEVVAEDDLGTQVWSWNDTQNGTASLANLSTTWLPLAIGNVTMTGTLSSNGTAIDSNSIQICLYTLIGCSSGSSGNGTGNGSSNSSSFAYANNKVSAGDFHTCAILDNGDLKCWGSDYKGQLGDGGTNTNTNAPSSTAIDLGTGRTAVAVSAGGVHTCAILDNGDLKCWGNDAYGKLGDGGSNTDTNAPSSTAIDLGTGRTAVAVSAGQFHTCAILDNGDLKCWGYDNNGQLGDGGSNTDTNAPSSTAIDLGTGRTAVAVSAGSNTCAILDNGDLKCWGSDQSGQLGDGGSTNTNTNAPSSTAIDLGSGRTAVAVSAGSNTCAILDNGDLKCWGSDQNGKLGDGGSNTDTNAPSSTAIDLGSGRTAVAVSDHTYHTCAILDNDDLKCWGYGETGQLGDGGTNSDSSPVLVSGNNTWNSSTGNSSNSIGPNGLGGNLPANWNVFWQTDELTNIAAGTSMQSLLQIEVPIDAEPDYYGFRLYIASTEGNISSSTLLVIEVTEEYEVSFAFLSQEQDFIPATSTNTTIQATNLGNGHQNYSMQLSVNGGPCTASLLEMTPHGFDSGEAKDIGLQLVVGENATASDSCDLTISAETDIDDTITLTAGTFSFTIGIDELVDFTIVIPNGGISVTPGTPLDYEIRVNNSGSEPVTYYLDVANNEGLTTLITSSTGVLVESGQVGLWTVSTDADIGQLGQLIQQFSITYSGLTVSSDLGVDVQPIASLEMSGPLDGRISVKPGQSTTISAQLDNTGTLDLSLVASLFGLPAGAEVELSDSNLQIEAGQSVQVNLTVTILSSTNAGSHMLTFAYGGNGTSASLSLDLQISQKVEVLLSGTTGRLVAGPIPGAELTFDVTNLGTATDTLHITLQDNGASQWFEFVLSSTSVSLTAGESSGITLAVREAASGAPADGIEISLIVSSSSDTSITDSMTLTIESLQAGATITVISDDDSAKPGETIHGSVVVTNSGTGLDNLLLTTVGDFDCGVSELFNLDAGASSQAITWACVIPDNAAAGISYFNFRVTSSARTTFLEEVAEVYTVEPVWGSDGVIFIAIEHTELSVPYSGGSSMILTLSNLANSDVTGNLSVIGMGDGLFSIEWQRMSDLVNTSEYVLGPGQSADFSVQFNSLVSTKNHAELTIRSISQIGSSTASDDSASFTVDIEGPQLPPSGISLPLGLSMSNSASINAMAAGWFAAILLLVVVRIMRNNSSSNNGLTTSEEEDEEEEVEEEEDELGYNECRMSEDNKVSCPSCDSRLGVPRGSTPPFRFSCPSCDNKIRVIE